MNYNNQNQGYNQSYNQNASGNSNNNHHGGGLPNNSGGGVGNEEFFRFQNVNPEMLKFGLSTGQDLINKQTEKFLPGLSGFWHSLFIYFSVDNNYVMNKLKLLMYPFNHKDWQRISADNIPYQEGATDVGSHKYALPKQDTNAPDLYIPLMSFVTYVLLCGLSTGLGETDFTPDDLIQTVWRCIILQIGETVIIKFGLSLMQVSLPFLDIFSYTGYKYVPLIVHTVSRLFGKTFSFLCAIYLSFTLAYFILKSFLKLVPGNVSSFPPRHIMLLGFAGLQFVVCFILSIV